VYDADDVAGRGSTGAKAAGKTVRLSPYDVLHIPGLGFDGLVGYKDYRHPARVGCIHTIERSKKEKIVKIKNIFMPLYKKLKNK
jgi:hypothetical protein